MVVCRPFCRRGGHRSTGVGDDRATGYIKVVTLLAVSLFMFGFAAVVSRVSLRLSALVIGIGVMGWSFFILVRTLLMKV